MWQGRDNRTAPYDLKRTLGSRISRFSGYGQQDSAELVNYLLDLIHEDLNRVQVKPYVEMSEDMNRPESVIAAEYWNAFQARNSSIIVDLMYGQLKSTVTCLTCRRVANAYDPYLSVCLPIIKEEKMEFHFVNENSHMAITEDDGSVDYEQNSMVTLEVPITKNMTIRNLKATVASQIDIEGVRPEDLVVANTKYGKLDGEIYADSESCLDIDQDFKKTMIFHVPNQTDESMNIECNFFRYMQRYGSSISSCDLIDRACPRFFAFTS